MAQLAGCAHVQRTGRGAFLSRRPRVPPCSISRAQCTSYRTTTCFSGSLVAMQKWRLFVLQTSPIRAGHGREDAFVFLLISASTSLFSTAHGHGSGNKRAVCSSDLPCTLILFLERESFFPAFHSITVTSLSWEAPTVSAMYIVLRDHDSHTYLCFLGEGKERCDEFGHNIPLGVA